MVGVEDVEKYFLSARLVEYFIDQDSRAGAHHRRLDERIFLLKLIRHRFGILQAGGGVPNQLAFFFRALQNCSTIRVLGRRSRAEGKYKK